MVALVQWNWSALHGQWSRWCLVVVGAVLFFKIFGRREGFPFKKCGGGSATAAGGLLLLFMMVQCADAS
ncbi:unnamed protein product [Meloidogyne enterolobii]|uniref:Uncharacterized protein n=1 Tax=Meloidogyne enterolobii TaxID=390850 RepID=A0ACB1B3P6_MELEN